MVIDVTKLLATFQHYADLVKKADNWVGNWAPNPKHFDPTSIHSDAGLSDDHQHVWFAHTFTDLDGTPRQVKATMQLNQIGTGGGADIITLDGQQVEHADFTIAAKWGSWGLRFAFEYKWVSSLTGRVDLRFDGA